MGRSISGLILFLVAGPYALAAQPVTPRIPVSIESWSSYRLVFSDDFVDGATIGLRPTEAADAQWFRSFFFGHSTTPPSTLSIAGGVLTMIGSAEQPARIQTAGPEAGPSGWGGRVFRNGAYFEARIALGPDNLATTAFWPAFWSMAIEHMAQRGAARWPGQPTDFMRFIEDDFFEYHPAWDRRAYAATMHEWYGRWESCGAGLWCTQSNANDPRRFIHLPAGQSWQDFHVYGQVWVPATARAPGYVQNYMDGRPVGMRVEWELGGANPPATGRHLYNVIDSQGLVVILMTGTQPMKVDWVRVWQLPSGRVEQR